VSVATDQSVIVGLYCDTVKSCKGFNIYRSEDGITYRLNGFAPFTGKKQLTYFDADVETSIQNYYYKAEMIDSCGNPRYMSNSGKTILLKVKNDSEKMFVNNIKWDNYLTWQGGVAGYYLYRVVNEQINTSPVDFIPFGINTYSDNVEDIVAESGKVGYFITAVENFGNPYGLVGTSSSNIGEAYIEGTIFVPNSFAPKGENRVWKPVTQFVEKTDYRVSVFNRWGIKVFETTDENHGWDGSGLDDNTYVYILQYKNARGEFIELKGTITMVR
jgi:gliding motility-associated-like protein